MHEADRNVKLPAQNKAKHKSGDNVVSQTKGNQAKHKGEGKIVSQTEENEAKRKADDNVKLQDRNRVESEMEEILKPRGENMVSVNNKTTPGAEIWPPKPPNKTFSEVRELTEREPISFTSNAQVYRFKNCWKVYKDGPDQREFEIQKAAGECSVKVYGMTLLRDIRGDITVMGFIMDQETPFEPKAVKPSQRRSLVDQMISVVLSLHGKGIIHGDIKPANMLLCSDKRLRLCDFGEARRVDEDPSKWEGCVTENYISPFRCRNRPDGIDPPPTKEDDLYALGLSIWELYTGKTPQPNEDFEDFALFIKSGKTVNVNEVDDEEVRGIIRKYLRYGGAKV